MPKKRRRKYLSYFDTQDDDEKVILLLRRHPIALLGPILKLILAIIIFQLANWTASSFFPALPESSIYPLIVLAGYIYILAIILIFFIDWIDYYLDVWIVTDRRIVDIEQKRLFNRQVSEQRIFRVQDVTSESIGLIPTVFKFGTVYVQTAGAKERFVFKQVHRPEKIKRVIIDIHDDLFPQDKIKDKMMDIALTENDNQ